MVQGYNDGLETIKLAAANEFAKGCEETRILIHKVRNEG